MKFRFSWIIFVLAVFVPFEVIVLKYLPVSETVYGILRFAVEFAIYLLAALVLARFVYLKKLPRGTSIDKPLMLFIGYALFITVINHAPLLESLLGLRTLIRYIPLFYILAFIHIDGISARRIFRALIAIAVSQSLIAMYQHNFGISQFWYPRSSDLEIGGKQIGFRLLASGFGSGREMGAGIGTMGDSVFLALFLVIVFIAGVAAMQKGAHIPRSAKLYIGGSLVLILLGLLFTYSRGSVLLALAAIPLVILFSGGRKRLAVYLFIATVAIMPIVLFGVFDRSDSNATYTNPKIKYTDPLANITTVFSSAYMSNTMQYSRGAVLTEIGGNLISSFKLLGYSPAQEFALEKAATELFGSNMPINNLPIINDVYWVAFIIYYGLIGITIYLFILYRIFRASLYVVKYTDDPYFRIFGVAMAALVVITIPYTLILRTFLFRSFGFYFWLIAGLVFSEWRRIRTQQSVDIESIGTTAHND